MILDTFEIEVGVEEDDDGKVPILEPFIPNTPCPPEDVLGRTVIEVIDSVGCYGMGGAGMFAVRLDGERKTHHEKEDEKGEVLVFALWGADENITVSKNGKDPKTIDKHYKEIQNLLLGKKITEFIVEEDGFRIIFDDNIILELEASARESIIKSDNDVKDFRKAVFLFPTEFIWV